MQRPRSSILRFLASGLLLGSLLVPFAQPRPAQALTLSPVTFPVSLSPGEQFQTEVKLENEQTEDKTYYSSVREFTNVDESGTPGFVDHPNGPSGWLTTLGSVTVKSHERITVPVIITVPADAQPGGHFAALLWSQTPNDQSQVQITAQVGILFFVSVKGDIVEDASIIQVGTEDGRSWYRYPPIDFFYRVQNRGGDRVVPEGQVRMTSIFGHQVFATDANPTLAGVLPDSIRRLNVTWGGAQPPHGFFQNVLFEAEHLLIGRYTVSIEEAYGTAHKPLTAKTHIWIIPWELLTVVAIILLAILIPIVIIGIRKHRRKRAAKRAGAGKHGKHA